MMKMERLTMSVKEHGFCADMRGRWSFTPSPPRAPQTRRSPALVISILLKCRIPKEVSTTLKWRRAD